MHVDLIAGLPYEGFDSFRDSFNELFSLQASELQLGTLKLLKGTSLKRKKELYGLVSQKQAPYEVKWTNWLNEAEMERIINVRQQWKNSIIPVAPQEHSYHS